MTIGAIRLWTGGVGGGLREGHLIGHFLLFLPSMPSKQVLQLCFFNRGAPCVSYVRFGSINITLLVVFELSSSIILGVFKIRGGSKEGDQRPH